MNYSEIISKCNQISLLSNNCIENEKEIEELLIKIENLDMVKVSDVSVNNFQGADFIRELNILRNRLGKDKYNLKRLVAELSICI